MMSHSLRKSLTYAAALVMFAGMVGSASAETTWQKNHPRRHQANHRLHHHHHHIHHAVHGRQIPRK
jgi:hypothetical protein